MLQTEPSVAKIGVDTAENEPSKFGGKFNSIFNRVLNRHPREFARFARRETGDNDAATTVSSCGASYTTAYAQNHCAPFVIFISIVFWFILHMLRCFSQTLQMIPTTNCVRSGSWQLLLWGSWDKGCKQWVDWIIYSFSPNLERLVLGCIDANFFK